MEAGHFHEIEFDHKMPTRVIDNPFTDWEDVEHSGEEDFTIRIHRDADPKKDYSQAELKARAQV